MVNTKKALEKLHVGVCDVYEYGQTKDQVSKITKHAETKVHTAEPCRLSTSSSPPVTEASGANIPKQIIKLFMDPSVLIKSGSKIVVTQNGRTTAYKNTGEPAMHTNHQELNLELFEKWS